ncbi:MAG: response regulator transcription factor, partial [Lachnospiraceae bacterium]|nr:response regulator transcription factor [Lachnospiraceae bacterium]
GWNLEIKGIEDFRNVMGEFAEFDPHLVLMDISLPAYDGYYWCAQIRKQSHVPIIFISSASENMNIIMAMNMGADDFISKPFDRTVLVAKVQALLRRTYDFADKSTVIEHKGAILNIGDNSISFNEEKAELSGNEFKIIHTLLLNKGNIVSREKLMEVLWETDSFVDENTLTVNVNRLRKKLDALGLKDFIATKFGVGYIVE